jgi:hypothetical protein
MAHQIRALSKDRLTEKCGEITDEEIREKIKKTVRIYSEYILTFELTNTVEVDCLYMEVEVG